jgi:hypothetical protein
VAYGTKADVVVDAPQNGFSGEYIPERRRRRVWSGQGVKPPDIALPL